MKYGAAIKGLYERRAGWEEIQKNIHPPDALEVTVESDPLDCWMDPEWKWGASKGCLPVEQLPVTLEQNRELLQRFKTLFKLKYNVNANTGNNSRTVLGLIKLSVADMRLDMRSRKYELAYEKWRDQFRFVKRYLHGRDDWVGKAIGLVAFGITLPVLEDILVEKPDIAKVHFLELAELLRPEGIEAFNVTGIVLEEYARIDEFLRDTASVTRHQDYIYWLIRKLGQHERIRNRYYGFAKGYARALNAPWAKAPPELAQLRKEYVSEFNWGYLIDPFGSLFVALSAHGDLRAREMLLQMYILDARLRLATLLLRMSKDRVKDEDIPSFLANAGPELTNPFSGKPMSWDPKNGRVYFPDPTFECLSSYMRVPVLDSHSGRLSPKKIPADIC